MMSQKENTDYDAIIIGSGIGGLTAAALLAKAGKKVLVLEKHYLIGGYASHFKRKKVFFDVSLHQIGGIKKTFLNAILHKLGIYEKLDFVKHPYLHEIITKDGKLLKCPNGSPKAYRKEINKLFPGNKLGIWLWFFLIGWLGKQVKIWDYANNSNLITRSIFLFFSPLFIPILMFAHRIKLYPLQKRFIKNEELRSILFILEGYFGKTKDLTILVPFIALYGYYFDGGYYVKGGGQAVSNAMKEVIEETNGKVMTSQDVTEVLVQENKATGVKTKKGATYLSNIVISNANPFSVYKNLVKNSSIAKQELKKIEGMELGVTCSCAYFSLDCKIEELNPTFKDTYEVFSVENDIVITFQTNIDPSTNPDKLTVFNVFIKDEYSEWERLDKDAYLQKKQGRIESLLSVLEKLIPNIKQRLKNVEYATPITMKNYTGNEKGCIYGFSQKKGQAGFDRFSFKSPIKNLYFSSAWVFPSGGYEGGFRSGYRVFQHLC